MKKHTRPLGQLPRLVEAVNSSLTNLGTPGSPELVERVAVAVYQSMGSSARQFHTLDHVFAFDPPDDLAFLAVLFHDVVYWGVDRRWPQPFAEILAAVTPEPGPGARLAPQSSIPFYRDLAALFGTEPGHPLPSSGVNELFSALALSSLLGEVLGRERTLEAAACIEATIPFRGDRTGPQLVSRLGALGFEPSRAEAAVGRALTLACQDVADFAQESVAAFLSGTWRLLPELNPELRIGEHFTVQPYRKALMGMAAFFRSLAPEAIFPRGTLAPSEADRRKWVAAATRNLQVAQDYLGAKLLAAALLEAAAWLTGGDAPLPLLMGAVAEPGTDGLSDHLPAFRRRPEDPVAVLLTEGRRDATSFDLKDSPLAAFVYCRLSPEEYQRERDRAAEFFAGRQEPRAYLEGWTPEVREPVIRALGDFVATRRDRIRALGLG